MDVLVDDLLLLVFCRGVETAKQNSNESAKAITCPSWLYAAVCKRWRKLALSNSILWTLIDVDISRQPDEAHPLQCYVSTTLERSNHQPLAVVIRVPATHSCSRTLTMLLDVQPRWQELSVSTRSPSLLMGIGTPHHIATWEALRSLVIDLSWQFNPAVSLDFRSIKTLEHFSESTTDVPCDILLPWKSLRSFHLLIRHSTHNIATRIESGPLLETCEIRVESWVDGRPDGLSFPPDVPLFPTLRRLRLCSCTPLLRSFQDAELEELEVSGYLYDHDGHLAALLHVLQTSHSTLRQLSFQGSAAAEWGAGLVARVSSLPSLQQLSVFAQIAPYFIVRHVPLVYPKDYWFDRLTTFLSHFEQQQYPPPCPSLRTFAAEWIVLNDPRGSIESSAIQERDIRDAWRKTWSSRYAVRECTLTVFVGANQMHLTWPPVSVSEGVII